MNKNINKKITIKLLGLSFRFIGTSLVLSSLFLTSQVSAEEGKKFNVGLNIGLSIANESISAGGVSISPSSRTGLAAGVEFFYDLIEYISLGAGIMYIQKGAEIQVETVTGEDTFNYLAIPIPAHFQANIKAGDTFIRPFALFSLEPSFLLSAKTKLKANGVTEEEDISDYLESLDFGIGFGGGVKVLFSGFFLSAQGRYILGLTDILKDPEVEVNNRVFTIFLSGGLRF